MELKYIIMLHEMCQSQRLHTEEFSLCNTHEMQQNSEGELIIACQGCGLGKDLIIKKVPEELAGADGKTVFFWLWWWLYKSASVINFHKTKHLKSAWKKLMKSNKIYKLTVNILDFFK